MKNLFLIFALVFIFVSCSKTEDDTNDQCTGNCTILKGNFVTLNNEPVPNVKVLMKYRVGSELGAYTRKLVDTKSDQNGNFNRNFFIKDNYDQDISRSLNNVAHNAQRLCDVAAIAFHQLMFVLELNRITLVQ